MKANGKNIHRGEVLQAVVKRSGQTVGQIAKRAGYSRAGYYHHIADATLPFEILEMYGKALNYDFTEHFPEMVKYVSFTSDKNDTLTLEQAIRERDQWRDKYLHLLERYNALMEEKLSSGK